MKFDNEKSVCSQCFSTDNENWNKRVWKIKKKKIIWKKTSFKKKADD